MRKTARFSAALLAMAASATAVTTASADPASYGDAIVVTFGANTGSRLPITLDLPAPDPGVAIASVGLRWRRTLPTYSGVDYTTTTVTPQCVSEQPCHVETTLDTGRFDESSSTLGVFVLAEDNANYGKMVHLLDGARVAGADTLGLMTDDLDKKEAPQ